jgi:hypothetical protein
MANTSLQSAPQPTMPFGTETLSSDWRRDCIFRDCIAVIEDNDREPDEQDTDT